VTDLGRRSSRALVVVVLALLCLAPTPGDVGGCGAETIAIDADVFAVARKDLDCERCEECGLSAPRCARACDPSRAPDTFLPSTCYALRHDGEVCLRALAAASCSTYATYVEEISPATPSECQFCEVSGTAPPPVTGFGLDAGGGPG
jgi:hypothetical protein